MHIYLYSPSEFLRDWTDLVNGSFRPAFTRYLHLTNRLPATFTTPKWSYLFTNFFFTRLSGNIYRKNAQLTSLVPLGPRTLRCEFFCPGKLGTWTYFKTLPQGKRKAAWPGLRGKEKESWKGRRRATKPVMWPHRNFFLEALCFWTYSHFFALVHLLPFFAFAILTPFCPVFHSTDYAIFLVIWPYHLAPDFRER